MKSGQLHWSAGQSRIRGCPPCSKVIEERDQKGHGQRRDSNHWESKRDIGRTAVLINHLELHIKRRRARYTNAAWVKPHLDISGLSSWADTPRNRSLKNATVPNILSEQGP